MSIPKHLKGSLFLIIANVWIIWKYNISFNKYEKNERSKKWTLNKNAVLIQFCKRESLKWARSWV